MDHIFFILEVTKLDVNQGKVKRLSGLRTNEKGEQLCSFDKVFEPTADKDFLRTLLLTFEATMEPPHLGSKYVVISFFGQDFYREMLNALCKRANLPKLLTRSWIGLEQIAWPIAFDGKVKDRSIESLAEYLKITANDPLWTLYDCYWTLMRRITTGILLEEKARSHGGPIFELAQKTIRQF